MVTAVTVAGGGTTTLQIQVIIQLVHVTFIRFCFKPLPLPNHSVNNIPLVIHMCAMKVYCHMASNAWSIGPFTVAIVSNRFFKNLKG